MKKIYEQPMTDVINVELSQLMMISGDPEDGFGIGDAPSLGGDIIDGNLSKDDFDLWN